MRVEKAATGPAGLDALAHRGVTRGRNGEVNLQPPSKPRTPNCRKPNETNDSAAVTAGITADSDAVTPAQRLPNALWLPGSTDPLLPLCATPIR